MIAVAPEVTGVAEGPHQWNPPVDAGGHAQQVVVREVADDDVAFLGRRTDRPQIRSKVCRPSFLDEVGRGPRATGETPLEVAAADKEQPGIDANRPKGAAVQLGDGSGAGPLVCKNHQAHSHALKVISFSNSRRHTRYV